MFNYTKASMALIVAVGALAVFASGLLITVLIGTLHG